MGEHLADGENVGSERNLERGERVAEAMERDVTLDARLADPFVQRMLRHRTLQSGEHLTRARRAAVLQRLVADGQRGFGLGLFGADAHPPAAVRGL